MTAVQKTTPTTKLVLAAVVASMAFAGVYAFATSLGNGSGGLGAGGNLVASCGNGMTFHYTTRFDPAIAGYAVSGIDLSHIPAGCLSKSLFVTFLTRSDGANGAAVMAALPSSGTVESIPIAPNADEIDVGRISGVSVVVS